MTDYKYSGQWTCPIKFINEKNLALLLAVVLPQTTKHAKCYMQNALKGGAATDTKVFILLFCIPLVLCFKIQMHYLSLFTKALNLSSFAAANRLQH